MLILKNSATGWDEINAMFPKIILNYIKDPLCHICNMSLEEGIFPSKLKIANVLPLFKGEEPSQFINYRPVSLLYILSKVFEKIMYNRLSDFLTNWEMICEFQFGFRKKTCPWRKEFSLQNWKLLMCCPSSKQKSPLSSLVTGPCYYCAYYRRFLRKYNRLSDFLTKWEMLYEFQFGFRKKSIPHVWPI